MEIIKADSLPLPPTLDTLGISPQILEKLNAYIAQMDPWHGLVVISGSDTLRRDIFYAFLAKCAEGAVHMQIIDEVKMYRLPEPPRIYKPLPEGYEPTFDDVFARQDESRIVQIAVTNATEYQEAGRSSLRWDPDALAFGDLPNAEVLTLAVNASLTGHRVIARIAGDSALGTLEQLRALNPELLPHTLVWILCANEKGFEFISITPEIQQLLLAKTPIAEIEKSARDSDVLLS